MVLWTHIQTMLTYEGKYPIDVSTFTMLQVVRFWSLAYCFKDGDPMVQSHLDEYQTTHKVVERPSFLEVMSYTFFCGGASIGVFFEFSDYRSFIKGDGRYKQVPSPVWQSLKYLLLAFAFAALNHVLAARWPDAYFDTDSFRQQSLWLKFMDLWMYNYSFRSFYYVAFMLQTGSVIASGLGYNGLENGEAKWDTVVSVYLVDVERSYSLATILNGWNH